MRSCPDTEIDPSLLYPFWTACWHKVQTRDCGHQTLDMNFGQSDIGVAVCTVKPTMVKPSAPMWCSI